MKMQGAKKIRQRRRRVAVRSKAALDSTETNKMAEYIKEGSCVVAPDKEDSDG